MYDNIATWYDLIFPRNEHTVSFLSTQLKPGTVRDLACGTGTYAMALADAGFDVDASDLDPAMIDVARGKTGSPVRFFVEDMNAFHPGKSYHGIVCIGNSFVHLESLSAMQQLLQRVHDHLFANGVLILQIINYDRILDQHITALPLIVRDGLTFERTYELHPHDSFVTFRTKLSVDGWVHSDSVRLFALRQSQLNALLQASGFTRIEYYGSYQSETYSASSFHLIAVASK